MLRWSLLALLFLMVSTASVAAARAGDASSARPVLLADKAVSPGVSGQNVETSRTRPSFEISDNDDVCYKIRAYIFKRDDDHAPELVRSTTCGPRKPHTKDTKWLPARVIPAD